MLTSGPLFAILPPLSFGVPPPAPPLFPSFLIPGEEVSPPRPDVTYTLGGGGRVDTGNAYLIGTPEPGSWVLGVTFAACALLYVWAGRLKRRKVS